MHGQLCIQVFNMTKEAVHLHITHCDPVKKQITKYLQQIIEMQSCNSLRAQPSQQQTLARCSTAELLPGCWSCT